MMGFMEWVEFDRKKKEREKKNVRALANQIKKTGLSVTKEKLLEMIRRSTQQSFTISPSQNGKTTVVVING